MSIINLEVQLQTDGDFYMLDRIDGIHPEIIDDYTYLYKLSLDSSELNIVQKTLNKILCDIHVSYTHEWLIDELYKFFMSAVECSYEDEYYGDFGGNYEGTYIRWSAEEKNNGETIYTVLEDIKAELEKEEYAEDGVGGCVISAYKVYEILDRYIKENS